MNYIDILDFRHACKIFDENKKIRQADFNLILEAGRLSPSAMGLEQWDFVVVQNKDMREKIRQKSWNQPQVTSCSHLVIILAKISDIKTNSEYVNKMITRIPDKTAEDKEQRVKFYNDVLTTFFKNDDDIFNWSHQQCLFPALNMMNAAASIGIDSCPMEGFEREEIGNILGLDSTKQRVAIIVAFGYRVNEQPPKYRRKMKDVVTWID